MDKSYIENAYRQAFLEFKCAHSEEEQWSARATMARLEAIAMQEYGFDYADTLKMLLKN